MGRLRELWYHGHHESRHHSNRTDGYIAPDGHITEVDSTHCDKRRPYSDARHGVGPEWGNPWHGTRTNAAAEYHPLPPAYPVPIMVEPVLEPVPVHVSRPIRTVVETITCPSTTVTVAYGPWRQVGEVYPHNTQPIAEGPVNPYCPTRAGRP